MFPHFLYVVVPHIDVFCTTPNLLVFHQKWDFGFCNFLKQLLHKFTPVAPEAKFAYSASVDINVTNTWVFDIQLISVPLTVYFTTHTSSVFLIRGIVAIHCRMLEKGL
jgi:hypothetical protein